MKKLALAGGVVGFGLAALLVVHNQSHAADHLDGTLTAGGNPLADINDVYAWMNDDASKLNLAMTMSPGGAPTVTFGPSVQYVFHVTSKSGLGVAQPGGDESKVICTFTTPTAGKCWITDAAGTVKDYVEGDFSATTGVASADGKVKVFAGLRSDPFFFNLIGFKHAAKTVAAALPALPKDNKGCPTVDTDTSNALIGYLKEQTHSDADVAGTPCKKDHADCFDELNTLAIVIQADKSLFNTGTNTAVGVWGSSHAAP